MQDKEPPLAEGESPETTPAAGEANRGELRRAAFLKAAEAVFLEYGYEASSMAEIVRRAGGSLSTLYLQFGDKEGLYRAVLLAPITHFTQQLRGFDDPSLSFEASMRMLLAPFIATPEKGARTSIYLASAPELEKVTGKYFVGCKEAKSSRRSHTHAVRSTGCRSLTACHARSHAAMSSRPRSVHPCCTT